MSNWEKAFIDWINITFNDYYVMICSTFEDGFKLVHHPAPIITDAFIRLIHNQFPWTRENPVLYSVCEDYFILHIDSVQLTIKPYDDEIHHTEYVKELM